MQRCATAAGAVLREQSPVTAVRAVGDGAIEVDAGDATYRVRRLVVTADAWTNDVLGHLGTMLPLTVTQEQVTYFSPTESARFAPARFPVWIWMDDPSWYGFPTYGEPTVKAAQDCGGPVVTGDSRSFQPDPDSEGQLAEFMARTFPGSGPVQRSKTCLYTLTPDRDFVLGALPEHPDVVVGLGAAHGFKFAPTFGRLLADLAQTGVPSTPVDLSPFRVDRPALTDADHPVSWLV